MPPRNRYISQRDVARVAKCDVSTVSLALRHDARLPPATRKRIQTIAEKLGYKPNPFVAAAMSSTRTRNPGFRGLLAYIRCAPLDAPLLKSTVFSNFLRGASERAAVLGYSVDTFSLADANLSLKRLPGILQARNVAGILIEYLETPQFPNRILPLNLDAFPAACLSVPLSSPRLHFAANDQYMRPIVAAKELFLLGYRRLGLILDAQYDINTNHRLSAGMWAVHTFASAGTAIPTLHARQGDVGSIRRWLNKHRPDAVLSTHTTHHIISDLGLKIPKEIGYVHLDWIPDYSPVAGVYGNSEHTGAACVDLVVAQIHRGEKGTPERSKHVLVAGSWIPGNSIRKLGRPIDFDRKFFDSMNLETRHT